MPVSRQFKIVLNYFFGPLLFLWLVFSIYHQIQSQKDLNIVWKNIFENFGTTEWLKFLSIFFLMIINWGIEARKWQLLIGGIEKVSWIKSFRVILAGQAFALGTINGVGEIVGRSVYLNEGNRIRSIVITTFGSLSQLIVTVFMGIGGLLYLRYFFHSSQNFLNEFSHIWMDGLIFVLCIAAIVFVCIYFGVSWIITAIEKIPFVAKYKFFIQHLENFHWKELTRILNLSIIRYVVFTLQYLLLLQIFKVDAEWWQEWWLIAVMFLVLAIVPTITLAELGLRGKLSIVLLGLISANTLGIILTATAIWLINKIIPAIIGSLFILRIRLFKK